MTTEAVKERLVRMALDTLEADMLNSDDCTLRLKAATGILTHCADKNKQQELRPVINISNSDVRLLTLTATEAGFDRSILSVKDQLQ